MSEDQKKPENKQNISRRNMLKGIAITAGTVVGASVGLNPLKAAHAGGCPGTVPKASLQYRPHPNGSSECDNCANFIAPHCCKVVAGPIVKHGWCMAYAPK